MILYGQSLGLLSVGGMPDIKRTLFLVAFELIWNISQQKRHSFRHLNYICLSPLWGSGEERSSGIQGLFLALGLRVIPCGNQVVI